MTMNNEYLLNDSKNVINGVYALGKRTLKIIENNLDNFFRSTLGATVGKGHFAMVKVARHLFTHQDVAVKVIDKAKLDQVSRTQLLQEVICMKLVQHPNIVRLYDVIDTSSKLFLVLELADGGDMYDFIIKHVNGLDEPIARKYFQQICRALQYCHQMGVCHRDLKVRNSVVASRF